MLKFPKSLSLAIALVTIASASATAQDAQKGKKVFKKCSACHTVGQGAKNRVGPHLNGLFERVAGSLDDYKYSKAMKNAGNKGLTWNEVMIDAFVAAPKMLIKRTKMSFAGLKKEKDRANLIACLKTFSIELDASTAEVSQKPKAEAKSLKNKLKIANSTASDKSIPTHGMFHLGRAALKLEVKAWDIDIRPDGKGLPIGKGTVAQGEPIYVEQRASCHGDFGEGVDRWPILAGGFDTLTEERPEKTIGSYWPYLSTVYDYARRAMPFGNARSLSDDDVYALTAYLLYLNDIVPDEEFELSNENFISIRLPNEKKFNADSRAKETHYKNKTEPCMKNCKPGKAAVSMRARVLHVTPD